MAKRDSHNRLYDTRHRKAIKAFRSDALFEKAITTLVGFGYTGVSEAIYDAVYLRLNELSTAHQYPTLKGHHQKQEEADKELLKALEALNAIRGDLGVMSS
ncbi:hypothetical protein OAA10_00295 [bacterium]|nr:hypothetical protein [bacterium]